MMIEKYNIQNVRYLIFKYAKEKNGLHYFARITVWKTGKKYTAFIYFMEGMPCDYERQIEIFDSIKDIFAVIKEYKTMIENI